MGEWLAIGKRMRESRRAGGVWAAGAQTGCRSTAGPQPEQEQMERYAEAFYGLARLFQKLPCQKEQLGDDDMRTIFETVREQVCAGCPDAQTCWGGNYFQSCRLLYDLLNSFAEEGELSEADTEDFEKQCGHFDELARSMRKAYGQARETLLWNNRMMEQRMAAGEQIYQTAELLRRTADSFAGAPEREQRIGRRMRRELRFLNAELENIRIFTCEDRRMEVYLTLRARRGTCVSAKSIAEALSECCREPMRPAWNCRAAVGSEPMLFHFVPDTRYQIFCGISRMTKAGELVSGDNFAFLQKDTGKVVMSLADGMGSGAGACRESEKVIELLEQFLDAGFPQETAVRMINSCMLLQNSSQMFSTIDLCMVDLYNARCDLIKSGAAPTFLFIENEMEVIHSHSFPVGVMQQSDYESMRRQLKSGAGIVMMTDGVLEALPEENREQTMAELIGRASVRNAQEFAKRLMERVFFQQNMQARDDMTILIGRIWEK